MYCLAAVNIADLGTMAMTSERLAKGTMQQEQWRNRAADKWSIPENGDTCERKASGSAVSRSDPMTKYLRYLALPR